MDLTNERYKLLKEARIHAIDIEGIKVAYGDVNCKLRVLTKNGRHLPFSSFIDLNIIDNLKVILLLSFWNLYEMVIFVLNLYLDVSFFCNQVNMFPTIRNFRLRNISKIFFIGYYGNVLLSIHIILIE